MKINNLLSGNTELQQKVDELTTYVEKLMENYELMNKEIFTVSAATPGIVKQPSDSSLKKGPKDMDKIRKDLD